MTLNEAKNTVRLARADYAKKARPKSMEASGIVLNLEAKLSHLMREDDGEFIDRDHTDFYLKAFEKIK